MGRALLVVQVYDFGRDPGVAQFVRQWEFVGYFGEAGSYADFLDETGDDFRDLLAFAVLQECGCVAGVFPEALGFCYESEFFEFFLGHVGLVGEAHPCGADVVDFLSDLLVCGGSLFDGVEGFPNAQAEVPDG